MPAPMLALGGWLRAIARVLQRRTRRATASALLDAQIFLGPF